MKFTLQDLGLAYRKAKVDLYYSSHPCLSDLAEYESNLHDNLSLLLERINGEDQQWINDEAFLGSWTLATKSISWDELKRLREKDGSGVISSSPADEWEYAVTLLADGTHHQKPKAEYRLMAMTSVDFHVLSALWMLKVGHLYDEKLSDCAYGNRLRRNQERAINPYSLGSFKPYMRPFRDWRDKGIGAMRTALANGKKIVALTADVSAFYHELNPTFLRNDDFNRRIGVDLSTPLQKRLHKLFVCALIAWASKSPLKKGLPVGLPASAVVANVALFELDRLIEQQVAPVHYGRYVDDILLVIENGANFRTTDALWEFLIHRSEQMLGWVDVEKKDEIQFQPHYLSDSQVRFSNHKNKVFLLAGETGKTLVDAIAHQIHERASEWRAMPNLPHSPGQVSVNLVAATQSDGEAADNLRKADALTMRRAGFAIKLRDFEAYERDLPPEAWHEHRHAFFSAFSQHVLVLPQFFELAIYLPRIIRLATACEDFEHLRQLIQDLERICKWVRESCSASIKSCPKDSTLDSVTIIDCWKIQMFKTVQESIIAAFPSRLSKAGKLAWQEHMADTGVGFGPLSIGEMQVKQARLFSFDLAHKPFRFIGMPREMIQQRGIPRRKSVSMLSGAELLLPSKIIDGVTILAKWAKFSRGLPHGLVFATRPLNVSELFVIAKEPFSAASQPDMGAVVMALRGFTANQRLPHFDGKGVLQIPDTQSAPKQSIAVSSWKTSDESWVASVMRTSDPTVVDRYARLTKLVGSVLSQQKAPRYLVLPELGLPAHWFMRIAQKLQGRGVSLITGIEYLHQSKGRVRNQVWAALSHDGLGFPSMMIYRQDKQFPALHEELELQRLAGLEMKPEKVWRKPPILQHGDFRFSLLICSELTNIGHRAALRGEVDALFVLEWNKDTESFNALVESAALDVHAYIVQCNDRQYGDSRIRAPHRDSWLRDVLRVKGGINDYCVTGEIDILALRQFQSSFRSPGAPFKPVPDGYIINHNRRVLPAAG